LTTSSSLADAKQAKESCAGRRVDRRGQNENIKGENMKLSVEVKVAAVVAAAFIVLPAGAMAQGRSKGRTGGANYSGPANNAVNPQMSQQGNNRSAVFGRSNTEESRPNFSDEKVTSSGREQREERHEAHEQREQRHNERAREERHHNREQRFDRYEAHRQRAQRYQNAKDKKPTLSTPFEGSLLDVKSVDVKQ
jgi:hypothetical protein